MMAVLIVVMLAVLSAVMLAVQTVVLQVRNRGGWLPAAGDNAMLRR